MLALLLALPAVADLPRFEPQEVATDLSIGYAVLTPDLNGDGKPDILVVDQHRVVWYENPTWQPRVILKGKTAPDNVCAAVADLDGDGQLDIVLGAGWKPSDTRTPGTLQWLRRGKTPDDEWTLFPIPCDEPTVHRIRIVDLEADGRNWLVVAPLQGRDSTAKGNWVDGRPVRVVAYPVPKEPTRADAWKPAVLSDSLFVVHNFAVVPGSPTDPTHRRPSLFAAGSRGLALITRRGQADGWQTLPRPDYTTAASEVACDRVTATIEPWHGNTVVLYHEAVEGWCGVGHRTMLDDKLRWGHAIKLADLDGDGTPEVIAGVRDDPAKGDSFTDRRGVRVYRSGDGWKTFTRHLIDPGGVAVEDLAVADLDGDGRPDLIAVGRQTKNLRIYWNRKP